MNRLADRIALTGAVSNYSYKFDARDQETGKIEKDA